MRITSGINKAIYIIAGEAIVFVLNALVIYPRVAQEFDVVVVVVLNLLYVGIGVRTFRGPGEDVKAPRAWWRATNRPLVGFIIAGVAAALGFISLVGALASPPERAGIAAVACVGWVLIAAYYANSSFRLRALDQPS